MLEFEPHPHGDRARALECVRRRRLRQVHELAVTAEVALEQLRVAIESKATDHQALEMAQQKIGQIESAEFGILQPLEHGGGRKELIAMRARDAFDPFFAQHAIELAAGPAIPVGNENSAIAPARSAYLRAHSVWDPLRTIMQLRWQAAHVQLGPPVGTAQR